MAPVSIVVVEDDADTRAFLGMLLEAAGYVVRTAAHGQAALDDLHRHPPPCCILLDLEMPVMDGRAFRLVQRAQPELAHVPVMVLSARPDGAVSVADLDPAAYLKKPFLPDQLLALVAEICRTPRE